MKKITKLIILSLLYVTSLLAQTPKLINYQGQLYSGGKPLENTVSLTFKIYDHPTNDESIWDETHPLVKVTSGVFSVLLGSVKVFTPQEFDDIFNSNELRYLGVKVGNQNELKPRHKLASTAFSIKALVADTARTIRNNNLFIDDSGNVGIGFTSPAHELHIASSDHGTTDPILAIDGGDGADAALFIRSSIGEVNRFAWLTIDPANNIFSIDRSSQNFKKDFVIAEGGKVGIGTSSPSERLDVSGNVKADGFIQGNSGEALIIVRGQVTVEGSVQAGAAFSASPDDQGSVIITFTTPFSGTPAVTANAFTSSPVLVVIEDLSAATVKLTTLNSMTGLPSTAASINFIAIGPSE